MTERPNNTRIHDWLDETVGPTPDPVEGTRQVMSQVEETSQAGRWLPFSRFHRKARTSASATSTTDTTEYQPSPIPATNGHTPTVIGRTQSMLSPVKAITAGAIVFALGGAFLIAQPFGQQGTLPGAEAEAVAPTWVTGTVQAAPTCSGPDSNEVDGGVRRSRNLECSPQMWTSSDPRLTGEVVRRWNDDVYQTDEGFISVEMDAAYLRNDGGGWTCSNTSLLRGYGTSAELVAGPGYTFTCTGDGGHAGLSAILAIEEGPGFNEEFVGFIFSGDFPPLPEPPPAE